MNAQGASETRDPRVQLGGRGEGRCTPRAGVEAPRGPVPGLLHAATPPPAVRPAGLRGPLSQPPPSLCLLVLALQTGRTSGETAPHLGRLGVGLDEGRRLEPFAKAVLSLPFGCYVQQTRAPEELLK